MAVECKRGEGGGLERAVFVAEVVPLVSGRSLSPTFAAPRPRPLPRAPPAHDDHWRGQGNRATAFEAIRFKRRVMST